MTGRARRNTDPMRSLGLALNRNGDDMAWAAQGACVGQYAELWFPAERVGSPGRAPITDYTAARAICGRCAVAAECLDYAIRADEPHGLWGGKTPAERDEIRRRRRGAA